MEFGGADFQKQQGAAFGRTLETRFDKCSIVFGENGLPMEIVAQ